MKYINKEYGIQGRPPFFDKFFEEKTKGVDILKKDYPNRNTVGFGLRASAINSASVCGVLGSMWTAEFSYLKGKKWIDVDEFKKDFGKFYAQSKNGDFVYISHGNITISMVKYSQCAVVVSISAIKNTNVRIAIKADNISASPLLMYNDIIKAISFPNPTIEGSCSIDDKMMIIKDRYDVVELNQGKQEIFSCKLYGKFKIVKASDNIIILDSDINALDSKISLFMSISENEVEYPDIKEINLGVDNAEINYTASKVVGSGELAQNASNIVSRVLSNTIYDRYLKSNILVENRDSVDEHFVYEPTGLAVASLTGALLDIPIEKQLSQCCGEPIVGALTSWIAFCRTRNHKILRDCLPKILKNWIMDGKLPVVDQNTKRELAYKLYDSALKESLKEKIYSIDYACYKLLAFDIAERMARIVDNKLAIQLAKHKADLRVNINENLFNKNVGLYMSKYLTGEFLPNYGITSFLPLVAGAVTDLDTLDRLIINLNDPKRFKTAYAIPTLSADNYFYGRKTKNANGELVKEFCNYNGMVSPLFNYLVYLGAVRYGVIELAQDVATSSTRQYNNHLNKNNCVYNHYLPNGDLPANATCNSTLGNLMGIIGMTELIDIEYFREDLKPALRFGTFTKGEHRLANQNIFGYQVDIIITPFNTKLYINNVNVINANGGSFVVRQMAQTQNGLEFLIFCDDNINMDIKYPLFTRDASSRNSISFNIEKGKSNIIVVNDKVSQSKSI